MHLLGGLGAQMGPSIDFRTIFGGCRDGFGRPWGPFGFPWGTEWRPERPKKREKYRAVWPLGCEGWPGDENREPGPA